MELTTHSVDVEFGTDATSSTNTNSSVTATEQANNTTILKRPPVTVRWAGIDKFVDPPKQQRSLISGSMSKSATDEKAATTTKQILTTVSGRANPGEVLALMGPSGSGKTTLLDVLSNRIPHSGKGQIYLNDRPLSKQDKRQIAYVKQEDIFFPHLTVRDQLLYTALLRLPEKLPRSAKVAEVEKTINILRLTKCATTPIMLISGGEKKRTNIGTELLTDPNIIMLDEPTSGLDSTSAVALLKILHSLAVDCNKTIITSIHQPSSSAFFAFDKLLLLADGNVVFSGTPHSSLEWFESKGHSCPSGYNGADHIMDLLVVDSAIDGGDGDTRKKMLIELWDQKKGSELIHAEIADIASGGDVTEPTNMNVSKWNTSYRTQLFVLTHRSMRNSRSAIFTWMNFVKSAGLGLIGGACFFNLGNSEMYVKDRSGFAFFAMTYWVFDSLFTALMSFPPEKAVIFKERASGAFRLSAYFISKTLSEAPMRLSLPLIYLLISYWMVGMNTSFVAFLKFLCAELLSVLAGER